jgi:hypothetical protein
VHILQNGVGLYVDGSEDRVCGGPANAARGQLPAPGQSSFVTENHASQKPPPPGIVVATPRPGSFTPSVPAGPNVFQIPTVQPVHNNNQFTGDENNGFVQDPRVQQTGNFAGNTRQQQGGAPSVITIPQQQPVNPGIQNNGVPTSQFDRANQLATTPGFTAPITLDPRYPSPLRPGEQRPYPVLMSNSGTLSPARAVPSLPPGIIVAPQPVDPREQLLSNVWTSQPVQTGAGQQQQHQFTDSPNNWNTQLPTNQAGQPVPFDQSASTNQSWPGQNTQSLGWPPQQGGWPTGTDINQLNRQQPGQLAPVPHSDWPNTWNGQPVVPVENELPARVELPGIYGNTSSTHTTPSGKKPTSNDITSSSEPGQFPFQAPDSPSTSAGSTASATTTIVVCLTVVVIVMVAVFVTLCVVRHRSGARQARFVAVFRSSINVVLYILDE